MSNLTSGDGQHTPDDGKDMQAKRKAWDAITQKRQAMINAEKQKKAERLEEAKEVKERQTVEYLQETKEAHARSEEREEWRQNQHAKRLEDEAKRRKEAAEREHQKALELKKQEQRKKEQESMAALHKKAVEKKVEAKIESAKTEEVKQKKNVLEHEDREVQHLDEELQRTLEHFDRVQRRKKEMMKADIDHKRLDAEEAYKRARHEASLMLQSKLQHAHSDEEKRAARQEESHLISQAEAARKRAVFGLDALEQQGLFDIDTEGKRLKDEAIHEADQRKQRAHLEADRKRAEAEARREGVEEWFGRDDKPLIRDHLDVSRD